MRQYKLKYSQAREHTTEPGKAIFENKEHILRARDQLGADRKVRKFLAARTVVIGGTSYTPTKTSLERYLPVSRQPAKLKPEFRHFQFDHRN